MSSLIDGLGKIFSSFKLTLEWYLFASFIFISGDIIGGLLLWSSGAHRIFRIPAFTDDAYRFYGSITLACWICTFVCLFFGIAYCIWKYLKSKQTEKLGRAELLKQLNGLSTLEKTILQNCLINNSRTYFGYATEEGAAALCDKGLLMRSQDFKKNLGVPYTIPLNVWEHLLLNRQIIEEKSLETSKQ